ncbi:UpxY family transcription antiterminator [Chitinophaga pendula]|uniref:transcription termination/antitermination protein NusG n=1 Tax=Chitinophaga TaxID=79328 RepID=UPI000BAEAE61|nr:MULTISPECIES: UpxY family transcription antiterminator [Chitinophaga]ASZ11952.1 hypothetical protein CK934_13780 [Chitinophaga sp. MD30]UCJ05020.1 UpxY family transcription antiterminator [Chitinophaga pendula]
MPQLVAGWYVMYTKAHHEQKVARQLSDSNIQHYLPMIRVTGTGKNVIVIREKPMFPSYVFVYVDMPATFYKSTGIDGYAKYVRFGNEMATLSHDTIERLKLITTQGRHIKVENEMLMKGQKLMIREGPLSGLGCEVIKQRQKNVMVTVNLLGKVVTAVIARQHLKAV